MLCRENVRELRLQAVRVLIFVHEHEGKVVLQHFADLVLLLEETESVHEEIVEVHRPQLALAGLVLLRDLLDLLRREARRARLPAGRDEANRLRLVRGLGNHLEDDLLLREVLRILHRGLDDVIDELLLVVLVDDLKARLVAERPSVTPQEPRADRMKRAGPD